MINISSNVTDGRAYVVVPKDGNVTRVYCVINGTIIQNNATLTMEIGTLNLGTITVLQNSGQGDIYEPPVLTNTAVVAGDYIKINSDGASANSVSAVFTIEITY